MIFSDAVKAVYLNTRIQLCIIHMVRNLTKFVSYKDLKEVCADLKKIYSAEDFGEKWKTKYPVIFKSWDSHGNDLIEFFKYTPEIRKAIYTTNAIESLNFQLQKVSRNKSTFPTDDAIFKMMYLALKNASKKWRMPIQNWGIALNHFAIVLVSVFRSIRIAIYTEFVTPPSNRRS